MVKKLKHFKVKLWKHGGYQRSTDMLVAATAGIKFNI